MHTVGRELRRWSGRPYAGLSCVRKHVLDAGGGFVAFVASMPSWVGENDADVSLCWGKMASGELRSPCACGLLRSCHRCAAVHSRERSSGQP